MLKAKLILTPSKEKEGAFSRNIKCVEGSGNQYYAHSSEKEIKVKVRPVLESDYNELYNKLGVNPDKIHKDLKELILSNISSFKEITIANSFVEIDGTWHYKLFYEVID